MKKGHITEAYKRRAKHRLRIMQGQLRGLEKMVKGEKYCMDILYQSLAIQKSLKSFDALMLENHLQVHAVHRQKGISREKAIQELLQLFQLRGK